MPKTKTLEQNGEQKYPEYLQEYQEAILCKPTLKTPQGARHYVGCKHQKKDLNHEIKAIPSLLSGVEPVQHQSQLRNPHDLIRQTFPLCGPSRKQMAQF